MCIDNQTMVQPKETFSSALNKRNISQTIKSVLRRAQIENRLTVGLLSSIHRLSKSCDDALFCITAPSVCQDSAYHMHEVLLEAFCLENDIYIVKVDSSEKLQKLLGRYSLRDCNCVLVNMPYSNISDDLPHSNLEHLSAPEKLLVEHCENNWGLVPAPVVKLPEE